MALSPSPAVSRVHSATDLPFSRPGTPVLHPANLVQAFVGLGSMGYFMARNIARQSEKSLLVWNRTRTKSEKLQRELGPDKVKIVDSIADVAGLADVIFTNLANDQVVSAVYDEIVSFLKACISYYIYPMRGCSYPLWYVFTI
jgi:NAD binding domain of 6-phosphogluconate dehydrogenase